MDQVQHEETEFYIGARSISAYSRLNYNMWYALAEFIDNSTQSRTNYDHTIDEVLRTEGTPLVVTIDYNKMSRTLVIEDNSIGMTKDDLINALKIAIPTKDSKGRSKYGIGMKTAACWIGRKWQVVTTEWSSDEEWTATIDVDAIAKGGKIPLDGKKIDSGVHYTKIVITDLHRNFQKRTEEAVRSYLGSMYRYDLAAGQLQIIFNGEPILAFGMDDVLYDTDATGKPLKMDIPPKEINGKTVTGWIAVMLKGGRKYGGFSLFQNRRQIEGYPDAWKPKTIFGGVDDEGANNLIVQRLTGLIELDPKFEVSHTKDKILFEGDDEEELENYLKEISSDYRKYADTRRRTVGSAWNPDKIKAMAKALEAEFSSPEFRDALNTAILPPLESILSTNLKQAASLTEDEQIGEYQVTSELKVILSMQQKSENDRYLTIVASAEPGTVHVIINGLHPYYCNLESDIASEECLRQYVHDAIAEYKVSKLESRLNPDSVRRFKDDLLRVSSLRIANAAAAEQDSNAESTGTDD